MWNSAEEAMSGDPGSSSTATASLISCFAARKVHERCLDMLPRLFLSTWACAVADLQLYMTYVCTGASHYCHDAHPLKVRVLFIFSPMDQRCFQRLGELESWWESGT